ncbi:DNA/RNA non-specific endonuclease [Sphingobium sp.]|uniref:DNA/RNA non-specific endonuclease n=1 Tax=Sphingobium sp. TaxID=1912891 RepID=UPI002BE5C9B5|nr:DNA/RNA non-specific endonuclease [Sphingobium sp.]HUD90624.1 DNA/RNA non-specific endonuclease [Sphingobium sp.]
MQRTMSGELTAFSLYLRTGRRVDPAAVEVKFNPWHDEQDGRFTFAGHGRYFPAGGRAGDAGSAKAGASRPSGKADRPDVPDRTRHRADHPDNFALYTVQRGDSLSRIAARRKGLRARDLAWLNRQSLDQPLRVGQQIKLPHQAYLDAGRAAKNKFLGLAHYMDAHGGKLPPDAANPPSLESQILDANWKRETRNGYDFHIDIVARNRRTFGQLSLAAAPIRSRRNQAQAGKPDRRASDDGGHFIAARFNGPRDSFNHFAQDANFNRGSYRAMEDGWAKELRAGHKVFVDIEPLYHGASKRPYQLTVTWYVDGKRAVQKFPNEAKGTVGGKR